MCIAIWKDAGKTISEEVLRKCFSSNPDGAGYMYVDNKELIVRKGFFTFDAFYEDYKQHEEKQCAIHFRIKTHGTVSEENCHPFSVTENLGFIHNGIISGYFDKEKSDTYLFNEIILKPLVQSYGRGAIQNGVIQSLLEDAIGSGSKLVFLDANGKHAIINHTAGNWDNGIWYSNFSWKPVVKPIYAPNNTSGVSQIEDRSKKYYVKRADGFHLYTDDWIEFDKSWFGAGTKEVPKGSLGLITHVSYTSMLDIELVDGTKVYGVPHHYVGFYVDRSHSHLMGQRPYEYGD